MKIPIEFLYLCSSISFGQKTDIITTEDEIGVDLSLLNFNYNLFVGKYAPYIMLPNVTGIDESDLAIDKNILDVTPMYRPMRSHILKALLYEAKGLEKIITTSSMRKGVCVKALLKR